jgi:hypothetical protein
MVGTGTPVRLLSFAEGVMDKICQPVEKIIKDGA